MERITSRKNPLLMKIRKLSSGSARARREAGEYLGDGVKLLEEALCWEAPLTTVVVTEGAQVPELPQGVRAIQVPQDVMETISSGSFRTISKNRRAGMTHEPASWIWAPTWTVMPVSRL